MLKEFGVSKAFVQRYEGFYQVSLAYLCLGESQNGGFPLNKGQKNTNLENKALFN
jgi:hypothetical protein